MDQKEKEGTKNPATDKKTRKTYYLREDLKAYLKNSNRLREITELLIRPRPSTGHLSKIGLNNKDLN